tara:strand:- start:152 stop:388 length:237 start_codon:yes stop_codon:yes gene_type:complete
MIDTDKYEGHTPAPWKINEIHSSQRWTGRKPVDVLLAEDAPLLLEEVKRLRAWKKLVSDIVQQHDGSHLREMLKEIVT